MYNFLPTLATSGQGYNYIFKHNRECSSNIRNNIVISCHHTYIRRNDIHNTIVHNYLALLRMYAYLKYDL